MKYKVGDWVIPHEYSEVAGFSERKKIYVGIPGEITHSNDDGNMFIVHGCLWHESTLTPHVPEDEKIPVAIFKNGEIIERKFEYDLKEFVLAALTGLCANEEGRMKILKDSKQEGISINQGIAKTALEIAKATINELNKEA